MPSAYRIARFHVTAPAYVRTVSEISFNFELIYNSMAWNPLVDEPSLFGIDALPGSHTFLHELGVKGKGHLEAFYRFAYRPNFELDSLLIRSISPHGSFEISFSGLSDAIDAAAEVCDPLRRRQRREQLRHDTAMNRAAEESSALDNRLKSLQIIQHQIDMIQSLANDGLIDPDDVSGAIKTLLGGQDTAAHQIEQAGVEIIDVADDDERSR